MATTTNFGWETPDDTDLVKDGALAMRTLGNAIDASLVDLKGGTTGQVLSKTSNTDMDFTWVTSDDANAIQNAIVDAKGDLITATAADTPARLAVGANDSILIAASGETTGLKWDDGTWLTWSPTITAGSGTFTTVSATQAIYKRVGKTVFYSVAIDITTAGTANGFIQVTLPSNNNGRFMGVSQNVNTNGQLGGARIDTGLNNMRIARYDDATFIASGVTIVASGFYRE